MCLHMLDFSDGQICLHLVLNFLPPPVLLWSAPHSHMCVCYTGSVVQVLFSISITKSSFSGTELSAKLLLFIFYFLFFLIHHPLRNF